MRGFSKHGLLCRLMQRAADSSTETVRVRKVPTRVDKTQGILCDMLRCFANAVIASSNTASRLSRLSWLPFPTPQLPLRQIPGHQLRENAPSCHCRSNTPHFCRSKSPQLLIALVRLPRQPDQRSMERFQQRGRRFGTIRSASSKPSALARSSIWATRR